MRGPSTSALPAARPSQPFPTGNPGLYFRGPHTPKSRPKPGAADPTGHRSRPFPHWVLCVAGSGRRTRTVPVRGDGRQWGSMREGLTGASGMGSGVGSTGWAVREPGLRVEVKRRRKKKKRNKSNCSLLPGCFGDGIQSGVGPCGAGFRSWERRQLTEQAPPR